ncbi:type II toxin-antitoxin system PrlF family antitoxin [Allosphingosinicella indica]|uniref:Looped-hinge helix DNA binding domain-containing protein, AbrB family n=1 Tax=Allosphingosinicella indica TaxID=941907 RepID=A0A1X7GA90_9SPHN|nr:type II toxin-antitoxin system PrlF family antitoxin [Allosphingosinicella indica]SMF66603.1 looped-hinge helix DNA binding domain-containing protein, AbrB family [Allosphingosinicella indica]
MILSRLTAKAQVTVPMAVRKALGLGPGDQIAWRIEGGEVIVGRPDDPFVNNFSTFDEWASEADCKAFDNL